MFILQPEDKKYVQHRISKPGALLKGKAYGVECLLKTLIQSWHSEIVICGAIFKRAARRSYVHVQLCVCSSLALTVLVHRQLHLRTHIKEFTIASVFMLCVHKWVLHKYCCVYVQTTVHKNAHEHARTHNCACKTVQTQKPRL